MDVDSPDFCKTNRDGFGGRPIDNEEYSESTFFYELTVTGQNLPEDATDTMIFEVEQRIADFLLTETRYFKVCGSRRRALSSISKSSLRRLQSDDAIAITINPRDEPLEGGKFIYLADIIRAIDFVCSELTFIFRTISPVYGFHRWRG